MGIEVYERVGLMNHTTIIAAEIWSDCQGGLTLSLSSLYYKLYYFVKPLKAKMILAILTVPSILKNLWYIF